jgi:hypothetical protein
MKELISENKNQFESYIQRLETEVIPKVNSFLSLYASLGIGDITKDELTRVASHKSAREEIRQKYEAVVWSEIKRLKINNPTLRRNMIESIEIDLDPVYTELQALYDLEEMSDFSIVEGKAVITDSDKANILERFRTYIMNESEKQFVESLQGLANHYNEFQRLLKDNNRKFQILPAWESLHLFLEMSESNGYLVANIKPESLSIIR